MIYIASPLCFFQKKKILHFWSFVCLYSDESRPAAMDDDEDGGDGAALNGSGGAVGTR